MPVKRRILILILNLLAVLCFLCVLVAQAKTPTVVSSNMLGGQQRYLSFLSTDRPVYRSSEDLFLRLVVLNSQDYTPQLDRELSAEFEIRGPKGNTIHQQFAVGMDSSVGYRWKIPADLKGGIYTVIARNALQGATETQRKFEIRAFRAPRLNGEIAFVRDAYVAGEMVRATANISRVEGGVPAQAEVTVIARVDGTEIYRSDGLALSAKGIVSTEFKLPDEVRIGDGSLTFLINDGGISESITKTLPIIVNKLSVDFYPESGELVSGLSSRVYMQITRPDGKPGDIDGEIVEVRDGRDRRVVAVTTTHEGRGVFTMTPEPDTRYVLRLTKPSGEFPDYPLPKVKTRGAVLSTLKPVYEKDELISIKLGTTDSTLVDYVTLYKREQLLDTVEPEPGEGVIKLDPGDKDGVLMLTAWNANGLPLAERLVFRKPTYQLNIELMMDDEISTPGSEVKLNILTTDDNGKPVEAVVGVTVTDKSGLNLIEPRDRAAALPVMVYLEPEVIDLADAGVYLDQSNPDAEKSLDLLLGTQGWRRFILVNYDEVKSQTKLSAQQVMAEVQLPVRALMKLERARQANHGVLSFLNIENAMPEPLAPVEAMPLPVLVEPDLQAKIMVMDADEMVFNDRRVMAEAEAPIMAVFREYAHPVKNLIPGAGRQDFTSTVFWHAGIRTGVRDGRATASFAVSDSITSFKVLADGYSRNGGIGHADAVIRSVKPFYVEPKLPSEITVGDVIKIPVTVVNASETSLSEVKLMVKHDGQDLVNFDGQRWSMTLDAGERNRQVITLTAIKPGTLGLSIDADSGTFNDQVTRAIEIKPAGFPVNKNRSGVIGADSTYSTEIHLPKSIVPDSLWTNAQIYTSPLANMQEALNALLRQPHGCFEQTSSTNYPLVMAQQYFQSHQGIDPKLISEAQSLLTIGYKKLIGFESTDNGYEWFGESPAHEALTAYGLMEFVDMAKVMSVDQSMIDRTRQWLLNRRDGRGGFLRDAKALDSFGAAPETTTNAYILWALLESGENPLGLKPEIDAVKKSAATEEDTYIVALAANIMQLAGDEKSANALRKMLTRRVSGSGALEGADTSITRSGGDALKIETTSLAILAWLNGDAQWSAHIDVSMKWLFEQSQSGRFGSTQSTVLALKAINAYDLARSVPKEPGTVQLVVNGLPVGDEIHFNHDTTGTIRLPDFAEHLNHGENQVELRMIDGSDMPFSIEVGYHALVPTNAVMTPLQISTKVSSTQTKEGEPVDIEVGISVGANDVASPVAVIGFPAGLELRHQWLQEMVSAERISAYEVSGSEVTLYWRQLSANATLSIPIQFNAAIPGTYTGPASRLYPYYTDEQKHWSPGLWIKVLPTSG